MNSQVFRQLSEITNTYTNASASEVGLVLAATQKEDLGWLLNYCRDQYDIVYPSLMCRINANI